MPHLTNGGLPVLRYPADNLLVATTITNNTGQTKRFPAAPLLARALTQQGFPAQLGDLTDPELAAIIQANPSITTIINGEYQQPDPLAHVLDTWHTLAGPRHVILAGPRSFCAGVERAVEIVERALAKLGNPIYVRKQIVHNVHVVKELEKRGAIFVDEVADAPPGSTLIFSAHGVSPAVRDQAAERNLKVIDATCPLVTKVHNEAKRFAKRGDTIVLIGHEGHEESVGTLGVAPDQTVLVETTTDVEQLEITGPVSYLTQTTLAVDEAAEVADALKARYPELAGPDSADICYATTNRQEALRAVAAESDLVVVIGSRNSSNSLRLVEIARRMGVPAQLVDSAGELELDWLAGARTIGLTAGASAPHALVDEVIDTLRGLGPVTVTERRVTEESTRFTLPKQLRTP